MLNNVVLMGRITADPELKYTAGNTAVCSFSIAVERSYKPAGGERETDFITIVTWRNSAEFVTKYFKKGDMIAVTGEIQTRKYTDRDNNKRTAFEVVAHEINFCGKKESPLDKLARAAEAAGVGMSSGEFEPVPDEDDLPF